MKNMFKELWGQANSPYKFKLPTLKEILIPAAVAGAFLIFKHKPVFIVPAFVLLFGVFFFWLLVHARNNVPVKKASGDDGAEHDCGGNQSDDYEWSAQSDTPAFNIDGTPMLGAFDMNGNLYGITSSWSMFEDD